ncbi:MAG: PQQ-dependent sugar dehydrogenase [Gemmatimonadota bacterium]|nr:PQQ-dependent sugar dehydrogenase [Gemmatimonadota bacterium]
MHGRMPIPFSLTLGLLLAACDSGGRPNPTGNDAPVITITSPATGTSVPESTAVVFAGSATDAEDGPLADTTLRWTSSIDGVLGTGDSLSVTTLTPGQHTITLRADDSAGATGSATITLTILGAAPAIGLDTIVRGLDSPVYLTAAPGDTSRLFVVEQSGSIRIIRNRAVVATPFLDLTDSVSTGSEQGLLGMAFAPDYAMTGRFYVSYTRQNGNSVVARYQVSANPDIANPASGQTILGVAQPYSNHNGGMIAFGPDGFLYFGLGDGGGGGDPEDTGQDRADLLGSLLRLDVSGAGTYTIPAGNPYAGSTSFRPELWNWGLRNPWRFSFDRQTGDLYIADVGQNAYEELNVQPAASAGGENYGWNVMEGTHCYPDSSPCSPIGLTLPVLDYDHGDGCSVTGGYVYRGTDVPSLAGHYLYADYCSGFVRSFRYQGGQAVSRLDRNALRPGGNITSFGEDARGEVYILTGNGGVHRIIAR